MYIFGPKYPLFFIVFILEYTMNSNTFTILVSTKTMRERAKLEKLVRQCEDNLEEHHRLHREYGEAITDLNSKIARIQEITRTG